MVDLARAERLRQARRNAGYARPIDVIEAFGWPASTYHGHENGSRGISRDRIMVYADAFRVEREWLASGRGSMRAGSRRIRIEGLVTNLGKIQEGTPEDAQSLGEIELPQGINPEEYVAYRVQGASTYPVWREDDIILVARRHPPPEQLVGKLCVITLPGAPKLIRTLMRGTRAGLFLLLSHAAEPMIDIDIIDAAPIEWTKHAG